MPTDQMHWRVAYSLNRAYHIIAGSNIFTNNNILLKINSSRCIRFKRENDQVIHFTGKFQNLNAINGLAIIFGFSPNDKIDFLHVYVDQGNATDAVNKMISLLDKKNFPLKHIEPITKF